jgi:O-antigen ligase
VKGLLQQKLNISLEPIPTVIRVDTWRKFLFLVLAGIGLLLMICLFTSVGHVQRLSQLLIILAFLLVVLYRLQMLDLLYLLLVFTFFLHSYTFYPGGYSYDKMDFVFFPLIIVYIVYQLTQKKPLFRSTKFNWAVILYFLVIIFETGFARHVGNSWYNIIREMITYPKGIILFYMVITIVTEYSQIDRTIKLVFFFTFIVSIYGVYQYLNIIPHKVLPGNYVVYREQSTFHNSNALAGLLELVLPVLTIYFLEERGWYKRFLYLLLAFPMVLSLLFTYSRAGFFSTLLALFVLFLIRLRGKSVIVIILLIILIFGIAANTTLLSRQFFSLKMENVMADPSLFFRLWQYLGYIDNIRHHPILGLGWGVAKDTSHYGYFVVTQAPIASVGGLNSAVFDQLVKGGVVYFLSYSLVLFLIIRENLRFLRRVKDPKYRKMAWGFLGSILAFLPHQLVDSIIKQSQPIVVFWLFMGLMYSAYLLYQKETGVIE